MMSTDFRKIPNIEPGGRLIISDWLMGIGTNKDNGINQSRWNTEKAPLAAIAISIHQRAIDATVDLSRYSCERMSPHVQVREKNITTPHVMYFANCILRLRLDEYVQGHVQNAR